MQNIEVTASIKLSLDLLPKKSLTPNVRPHKKFWLAQKILNHVKKIDPRKKKIDSRNPRKNYDPRKKCFDPRYHATHAIKQTPAIIGITVDIQ